MSWLRHLFVVFFLSSSFVSAYAQDDLEKELEAIDDLPEDDLAAGSSVGEGAESSPEDAATSEPSTDSAQAATETSEISELSDEQSAVESLTQDNAAATASTPSLDDLPIDESDYINNNNEGLAGFNGEFVNDPENKNANPAVSAQQVDAIEALTGVDTGSLGKVSAVEFKQLKDRVRLYVKSDRPLDWSRELRSDKRQVVIELKNMNIGSNIVKRALDTGEFDGPVAYVKAFDAKLGAIPTVKVLFQLRNFVDPTVLRSGNDLYVDFPIAGDGSLFKQAANAQVVLPETFLSGTQPMEYKGARISLNVKNAGVSDVINLISKVSGENFVIAPGVDAKVTVNVKNLPWDQVLTIILLNAKLGYQKTDGIYRIANLTDLKKEIEDAIIAEEKKNDLIPLQTRLFAVSYATASEIQTNIKDFLSKRGKIAVDRRTNSMTVTDIPEVMDKIDKYIKTVDKQTPQVLIEARIVEASKEFNKSLNVRWNMGNIEIGRANANTGTGAIPPVISDATARFGTRQPYTASGVGDGGGGVGLNIGQLGNLGSIDLLIGAAEFNEEVKQIAAPKVTVLNNQPATISQGFTRTVLGAAGTDGTATVQQQRINTTLTVTPQVTSDANVLLNINLARSTPDGTPGQITAADSKDRSAVTQMLVPSGKTAVIGGLYTSDVTESETGVPGLNKIPIIGSLFKPTKSSDKNLGELLMFISPKILNADKAFLVNSLNMEPLASSAPVTSKSM